MECVCVCVRVSDYEQSMSIDYTRKVNVNVMNAANKKLVTRKKCTKDVCGCIDLVCTQRCTAQLARLKLTVEHANSHEKSYQLKRKVNLVRPDCLMFVH